MNKELEDIVFYIKNSDSYKKCIELKEKMSTNVEIKGLVDSVKKLQKEYVRSNYQDDGIKKELNTLNERLNSIPIYVDYISNLSDVNNMISLVTDSLNDYFYKLLNENN